MSLRRKGEMLVSSLSVSSLTGGAVCCASVANLHLNFRAKITVEVVDPTRDESREFRFSEV